MYHIAEVEQRDINKYDMIKYKAGDITEMEIPNYRVLLQFITGYNGYYGFLLRILQGFSKGFVNSGPRHPQKKSSLEPNI